MEAIIAAVILPIAAASATIALVKISIAAALNADKTHQQEHSGYSQT